MFFLMPIYCIQIENPFLNLSMGARFGATLQRI